MVMIVMVVMVVMVINVMVLEVKVIDVKMMGRGDDAAIVNKVEGNSSEGYIA